MKCYAVRRSDGQYLRRHYGIYSPFSPFNTKFFSTLKGATNTAQLPSCLKNGLRTEVVEFELTETKTYEI